MAEYILNPAPLSRKQKPDLCSTGVVQMVCDRRGIQYGYGLEDLAVSLKLHIDEKYKDMFGPQLRERALPHRDPRIGLLFENFKNPDMQKRIKKVLGLKTRVYHPNQIGNERDIARFIAENIGRDNDILMNYWLGEFNTRRDGHYALIFGYNEETNEIYAADPSPFIQEYWRENLRRFVKAMQPIWPEPDGKSRERGLVIFNGPNHRPKDDPLKVDRLVQGLEVYKPVWTKIEIVDPKKETSTTLE